MSQEQSELNDPPSIQDACGSQHSQSYPNLNQKEQEAMDQKPENKKTLKEFSMAGNVGKNKMDEYQKGMLSTDKTSFAIINQTEANTIEIDGEDGAPADQGETAATTEDKI